MNISRNYNRGKSFRFSDWEAGVVYKNDDFVQDFVKYKEVLYACVAPFTSKIPEKSKDWEVAVKGVGATFIPHVDRNGNLTWTNDSNLENPSTVNIKGPKGDRGLQGEKGSEGPKGDAGLSAYQIWLKNGNKGSESDFLESLKVSSSNTTTMWNLWKTK